MENVRTSKSLQFYLDRGFDEKTARYYLSGRRKIIAADPRQDFTLLLTFDNGEQRIYDCKPVIADGGVFQILSDYSCFQRVYLDDTNCVSWDKDPLIDSDIHWDNKLDLSSDSCYLDSVPAEPMN